MSFEGLKGAGVEFSKSNFDGERSDAAKLKELRETAERQSWPEELKAIPIGFPLEKTLTIGGQRIDYKFAGYDPENQTVLLDRTETNGRYIGQPQIAVSLAEYLLHGPQVNKDAQVTLEDLMNVYDRYSPRNEALYNNESNYEEVGDVLLELADEDQRFAKYGTMNNGTKVSLADGIAIIQIARDRVFPKISKTETDEQLEEDYRSKDSQAQARAYSRKVRKTLFS